MPWPWLRPARAPIDSVLVATSFAFLAPLVVRSDAAARHHQPMTPVAWMLLLLAGLTCVASVTAWLDFGSRRKRRLDKVVARASGAVFTAVGVWRIPPAELWALGLPTWAVMAAAYGLSRALPGDAWVVAHAAFHVAVAWGMCQVVNHA